MGSAEETMTSKRTGDIRKRSARCLMRFLLWAQDEAVEELRDNTLATKLQHCVQHLRSVYNVTDDQLAFDE